MENMLVETYLQIIQDNQLEQLEEGYYGGMGQVIIKLTQGQATVAGIAAAAAILYMTVKAANFLATSKECRNYKQGSPPWRVCEKKVIVANKKRQIAAINSKANLCNNSKDPAKCKAKLKEKITKLQMEVREQEKRIKELQAQITK